MASITNRTTAGGEARYDVHYRVNGAQRHLTFRIKKEATSFRSKAESDEEAGLAVDPRAGDITFKQYSEDWLETRLVKGRPLSPMTVEGYSGLLRRHLLPSFGATKIRRITADGVRRWYAKTTEASSADQAAKAYRLLRAIMNTAVEDDCIGRNPCRIRGAGIEHAAERWMPPTPMVLDLADAIEPSLRAAVQLVGFAGLRTGELLGLQRQDIDELHGIVHVRRQVIEVSGKARRGGPSRVVTSPKTAAGLRSIALPRTVMEELATHLATYVGHEPDAPVFPNKRGDQPLRRAALSIAWRAALQKVADTPDDLHRHDLRHHAHTMAARSGVTTKELMARMGQSSPRAALIYQHATAERDRVVADYLDAQIAAVERPEKASITKLSG